MKSNGSLYLYYLKKIQTRMSFLKLGINIHMGCMHIHSYPFASTCVHFCCNVRGNCQTSERKGKTFVKMKFLPARRTKTRAQEVEKNTFGIPFFTIIACILMPEYNRGRFSHIYYDIRKYSNGCRWYAVWRRSRGSAVTTLPPLSVVFCWYLLF